MYTLLSGLYRHITQKDQYYILILGLDNAGKTTYLEQTQTRFNKNYKSTNLSRITTTVGLNIGKIDVGKMRFNFWDLGGQEELQLLWDKYYAECHAVVYMIDSAETDRWTSMTSHYIPQNITEYFSEDLIQESNIYQANSFVLLRVFSM